MDGAKRYVGEIKETLDRLPWDALARAVEILHDARLRDRQVFIMGNGGSAATASHFACDLGKGTLLPGKPRFRVIALTDNMPLFSALANDYGYHRVFVEQLASLVRAQDIVIGISGSGKSLNVINALHFARQVGATTIGMTGFDGGKVRTIVDLWIHVPNGCMEQVEDLHLLLEHLICTELRHSFGIDDGPEDEHIQAVEIELRRAEDASRGAGAE